MSGIEVIGVVLGAAPLIISALTGYQKLGKKRDAFQRKSLHIDRMVRALMWQQKLIQSDIKIVLRSAGLDETTVDQHGGIDSYQDLLKRQDVQDAMSAFLGELCPTYVDIVHQYESTLLRVAKSLDGFEKDALISTGSLAAITCANQQVDKASGTVCKRIKFSMHKDDLEASIREIDEYSRLLERLRERSQHDYQSPVQPVSLTTNKVALLLQKVQSRASRLYKALAQSWTLSCQDPHGARLYLDHRIDTIVSNKKELVQSNQNNVKFSLALRGCSNLLFHTCVVEVLNANDHGSLDDCKNATVRFRNTPATSLPIMKPDVDNICKVLHQTTSKTQFCKLYVVEDEKLHYEHLAYDKSDCRLGHEHGGRMVCLKDLLQDPIYKGILKLKLRVRLAATMASSTLQLHTTPWCTGLHCDSVWFVQGSNGAIDLENPFVACNFGSANDTNGAASPSFASPGQAESELLDLGVMILELWHNEIIDTFAYDSGVVYEQTFECRQRVARKWIAETKDDMLTSIYDAAVRCVNCRFDAVDIVLTDHKLNVSIFNGVVRPLAENCKA